MMDGVVRHSPKLRLESAHDASIKFWPDALRPHTKQAFAIILSPDILSDIYIKYGLSFYQRI